MPDWALRQWCAARRTRLGTYIVPDESVTATVERYDMRAPSEKAIPTTRIEAPFPREIRVIDLELVDGWRLTTQKDGE